MTWFKQLLRILKITRRIGSWKTAKMLAQQLPRQAALFTRLLSDSRVPIVPKVVLVGAIVFAVSPLNIPNYIPIIGVLDDIGLVLFGGSFFLKRIPLNVLAEHRRIVGLPTGLVEA